MNPTELADTLTLSGYAIMVETRHEGQEDGSVTQHTDILCDITDESGENLGNLVIAFTPRGNVGVAYQKNGWTALTKVFRPGTPLDTIVDQVRLAENLVRSDSEETLPPR